MGKIDIRWLGPFYYYIGKFYQSIFFCVYKTNTKFMTAQLL